MSDDVIVKIEALIKAKRDGLPKVRPPYPDELSHVLVDTGEPVTDVQRGSLRGQSAALSWVLHQIDALRAEPSSSSPDPDRLRDALTVTLANFGYDVPYDRGERLAEAVMERLTNPPTDPNPTYRVAQQRTPESRPADDNDECKCGEPRWAGIHDAIRTWVRPTPEAGLHAFVAASTDESAPESRDE